MYLARERIHDRIHYYIRDSFESEGCFKSRNLYDLGTAPERYISYPGGKSYYYEPDIIDTLKKKGVDIDQDALDTIFFDFLLPEVQRVITGFDRRYQGRIRKTTDQTQTPDRSVHLFDKRRFHFLRFGARMRQQIHRQPESIFRPVMNKSRDEIEQYFLKEERILKHREVPLYVAAIFNLQHFLPDATSDQSVLDQLDQYFLTGLCQLDQDRKFWAGAPREENLHHYLIKYAIMYFDVQRSPDSGWQHYFQDFINRHRAYAPPRKVQMKIKEAEALFGLCWKELNQLSRKALSRLYRRLALKHHPDQGGNSELFSRLTQYYQTLLSKKKKN